MEYRASASESRSEQHSTTALRAVMEELDLIKLTTEVWKDLPEECIPSTSTLQSSEIPSQELTSGFYVQEELWQELFNPEQLSQDFSPLYHQICQCLTTEGPTSRVLQLKIAVRVLSLLAWKIGPKHYPSSNNPLKT